MLVNSWLTQPLSSLDVTFAEEIFILGIFSLTAILPILFSLCLFYLPAGHTAWGTVLTGWHGAIITIAIIFVSEFTTFGAFNPPWIIVIFFTPLLGLAGGVLGIFWKPSSVHNT